jgi:hypothetical protein
VTIEPWADPRTRRDVRDGIEWNVDAETMDGKLDALERAIAAARRDDYEQGYRDGWETRRPGANDCPDPAAREADRAALSAAEREVTSSAALIREIVEATGVEPGIEGLAHRIRTSREAAEARAAALEARLDTLATKEARCHETIRALEAERDEARQGRYAAIEAEEVAVREMQEEIDVRDRDIEAIAHAIGCREEWTSAHDHYDCVRGEIHAIVATAKRESAARALARRRGEALRDGVQVAEWVVEDGTRDGKLKVSTYSKAQQFIAAARAALSDERESEGGGESR